MRAQSKRSGKPAESAPTDEDAIEAARFRDRGQSIVDVRFEEPDPVRQAEFGGQRSRRRDRGRREIDTGDRRALLREHQGVHAEMALQMQDTLAIDGTEDVRARCGSSSRGAGA